MESSVSPNVVSPSPSSQLPADQEVPHTALSEAEAAAQRQARRALLKARAQDLTDAQLLARVVGAGFPDPADALALADTLLDARGGLNGVAASSETDLRGVRGVGLVRAGAITAALELGMRLGGKREMSQVERWRRECDGSPAAVFAYGESDDDVPVTLALEPIDGAARPGSLLANCLAHGMGPWELVAWRPDGKFTSKERKAALLVLDTASLVGAKVSVTLLSATEAWTVGRTP